MKLKFNDLKKKKTIILIIIILWLKNWKLHLKLKIVESINETIIIRLSNLSKADKIEIGKYNLNDRLF